MDRLLLPTKKERAPMKILISWSGERSKRIALALSSFVKDVIQATEPWVSERDIAVGSHWHEELWAELKDADAGIVCLTPENVGSLWIHYEAGALAKTLNRVCVSPYLHDLKLSDLKGPLQYLQAATSEEEGTRKLLSSINQAMGAKGLPEEKLRRSFDAYWSDFQADLKKIPAPQSVTKPQPRATGDILEELLAGIRDLQNRVPFGKPQESQPAGPAGSSIDFNNYTGNMEMMLGFCTDGKWRMKKGKVTVENGRVKNVEAEGEEIPHLVGPNGWTVDIHIPSPSKLVQEGKPLLNIVRWSCYDGKTMSMAEFAKDVEFELPTPHFPTRDEAIQDANRHFRAQFGDNVSFPDGNNGVMVDLKGGVFSLSWSFRVVDAGGNVVANYIVGAKGEQATWVEAKS